MVEPFGNCCNMRPLESGVRVSHYKAAKETTWYAANGARSNWHRVSLTRRSPFPVAQDHDGKLDTSDHAELVEFIKPKKTGSEVVGLTQLEPEPEFDLAAHPEHEVDAHKLAALSIKNYKLNQRDFQLRVSHAKEDSTAVARLATSHSWHTSSTKARSEKVRTVSG